MGGTVSDRISRETVSDRERDRAFVQRGRLGVARPGGIRSFSTLLYSLNVISTTFCMVYGIQEYKLKCVSQRGYTRDTRR